MLEFCKASKRFGPVVALDGCTFSARAGRLTGFLGPNGAGKTTSMRAVFGLVELDAGTVTWEGAPIGRHQRARFGYMPEERGLYPKMKLGEQLIYLARLHGLTPADAKANTDELLARLSLGERAGDAIEKLSLGNQQRAQIAAALVHDPEVLILDEPFSGLDPMAVDVVVEVLAERARRGVPVLFSSHQLDIVERLCDDLVIIAAGAIRAAGPREALRAEHATLRYQLQTDGDAGWVRETPGITVIEADGGYALFDADDPDAAQRVLAAAVVRGGVSDFARQHPSLSQIFKEVVR